MMDLPGIDKVHLYTRAFTVTNGLRGWSEKVGRKVGEAPPCFLHDHTGQPIEGSGFYLKTEHAIADVNPTGLLLKFNPSKVRHPYHLLTDPAEVGRIADGIERDLKAHGVLVNINAMQTVRVDLAKQKQLTHQLTTYVPALSHLKGKRMKGHTYPDGYSFRNTQREAVFYNKAREVLEKQRITVPEDRLGRFEVKWKKGRPLAKDLQLSAFGDIRRADPEQLAAVYREALHRDVFRTDPKAVQLFLNLDTDLDVYRQMKQQHARGAMWQYLALGSTTATIEAHGGLESFGRFLINAGDNPRTVRHNLQMLRARLQRDAFINARRDKAAVNLQTLLDELKHAFAA